MPEPGEVLTPTTTIGLSFLKEHVVICGRGIMVLGLDAPAEELAAAFRIAAPAPWVKGFAVGRTIFAAPARAWLADRIDDAGAVAAMAASFAALVDCWNDARTGERA